MTFKIGDDIIMTADSRKGKVFEGLQGEYKGKVIVAPDDYINMHPICIQLENGDIWSFKEDGSRPTSPGMSIRLANCAPGQIPIEKPITPSQWIKGQIPDDYRGWLWIWHHLYSDPTTAKLVYSGDTIQVKKEQYSHWMPAELPPPPPAKEVEAFGYLEYMRMFFENSKSEGDAELARAFYSQPATAEVLEKYLCRKTPEGEIDRFNKGDYWPKSLTMEAFIWYYKYYADQNKLIDTLLFTPAALKELGIK